MTYADITNIVQNLPLANIDLLSVGLIIAAIAIMGFAVYTNNKNSITNKSFFLFSVVTILWSFFNYMSYQVTQPGLILWLSRLVIFLGVWHSFSFFQFLYVYPKESHVFPRWYTLILLPYIIALSIFTLTPLVFSGIHEVSADGTVSEMIVEKGIIVFGSTVITLLIISVIMFIIKTFKAVKEDRNHYLLILTGTIITFAMLFTFNLILPGLYLNVEYIPLGGLYIFPFAAFTAYAIYRHKAFNIKNVAYISLAFVACFITAAEFIFVDNNSLKILVASAFLVILLVTIEFIRNLSKLQIANEGQENLMHIMNHQIKGYLGNNRVAFAEILSGDYGPVADTMKPLLEKGMEQTAQGVEYVQNILKGASAAKGILVYDMKPTNAQSIVEDVLTREKSFIEGRNQLLTTNIIPGEYNFTGDAAQLGEAFRNLIENAVRYNKPPYNVTVSLAREGNQIVFSVKDSGKGIAEEDKAKLFTAGGRGKDSAKDNPETSGFGLVFVKGVVEAHKGIVGYKANVGEAGTTFFIKLPISSQS